MSQPTRVRYVEPFTPINWILLVVAVIAPGLASVHKLFHLITALVVPLLFELTYYNVEIDPEKGTVTTWRGLVILPLLTRKRRQLSDVTKPLYTKTVGKPSGRYKYGNIKLNFSDGSQVDFFESGNQQKVERVLEDLTMMLAGGPISPDLVQIVNPNTALKVVRRLIVGFMLVSCCGWCSYNVVGDALKSAKRSRLESKKGAAVEEDEDRGPCDEFYSCCLVQAKTPRERNRCKSLFKKSDDDKMCRKLLAKARKAGKCE